MNKLFLLVLIGVILCAGGMIYFLHPGGNNLFVSSAPSGASAPSDGPAGPPESSSTPTASSKPTAAPSKSESSAAATGSSKPESAASGSPPSGTAASGTTTAESGKPAATPAPTPGKTETPKPGPVNDAELSPSAAHVLRDISVEAFEQQVILRIEAEGPFPVKTFLLPNPNRLVVDLPGDWTNIKAPSVPQNRLIRSARLGSQSSGPRLVLDLRAPLTSRTVQRPDSNTVEITLE